LRNRERASATAAYEQDDGAMPAAEAHAAPTCRPPELATFSLHA